MKLSLSLEGVHCIQFVRHENKLRVFNVIFMWKPSEKKNETSLIMCG